MDTAELFPPNVVLFSSHRGPQGHHTPDSPLSSAPGSPHSTNLRLHDPARVKSSHGPIPSPMPTVLSGEEGDEPSSLLPRGTSSCLPRQYLSQRQLSVSSLPFDERIDRRNDEKKTDHKMTPEESGMVPMTSTSNSRVRGGMEPERKTAETATTTSTPYPVLRSRFNLHLEQQQQQQRQSKYHSGSLRNRRDYDDDHLGPEDEQELSHTIRSPFPASTSNATTTSATPELRGIGKPATISRRMTTGDMTTEDIHTPYLLVEKQEQQHHQYSLFNAVTPSPQSRIAAAALDDRAKMEQHMNFAAVKRDILSAERSLQQPAPPKQTPSPLEHDEVEPKPSDEEGFYHPKYPAPKVVMEKDESPQQILSPATSTPLPNIKSPPYNIRLRAVHHLMEQQPIQDLSLFNDNHIHKSNNRNNSSKDTSTSSVDGAYPSFYTSSVGGVSTSRDDSMFDVDGVSLSKAFTTSPIATSSLTAPSSFVLNSGTAGSTYRHVPVNGGTPMPITPDDDVPSAVSGNRGLHHQPQKLSTGNILSPTLPSSGHRGKNTSTMSSASSVHDKQRLKDSQLTPQSPKHSKGDGEEAGSTSTEVTHNFSLKDGEYEYHDHDDEKRSSTDSAKAKSFATTGSYHGSDHSSDLLSEVLGLAAAGAEAVSDFLMIASNPVASTQRGLRDTSKTTTYRTSEVNSKARSLSSHGDGGVAIEASADRKSSEMTLSPSRTKSDPSSKQELWLAGRQQVPMQQQQPPPPLSNAWSAYLTHRGALASSSSVATSQDEGDGGRGVLTSLGPQRFASHRVNSGSMWMADRDGNDQDKSLGRAKSERVVYRQMTPKKDFQSSENSAWWLQEELERRSIIKREINHAILSRDDHIKEEQPTTATDDATAFETLNSSFAVELAMALNNMSPRLEEYRKGRSCMDDVADREEIEDEEVAAITSEDDMLGGSWDKEPVTREDQRSLTVPNTGYEYTLQTNNPTMKHHSEDPAVDKPFPRRLKYDSYDVQGLAQDLAQQSGLSHTSLTGAGSADGMVARDSAGRNRHNEALAADGNYSAISSHRRYASDDALKAMEENRTSTTPHRRHRSDPAGYGSPENDESYMDEEEKDKVNVTEEMQRFVSATRAALRGVDPNKSDDQHLTHSPFRSIAIVNSGMPDDSHSSEADASIKEYAPPVKSVTVALSGSAPSGKHIGSESGHTGVTRTGSAGTESAGTNASEFAGLQSDVMPVLIESMDSGYGIAKGDITLSLLNENTGRIETSKHATWAGRVHGAIWRGRMMRRSIVGEPTERKQALGTPAKGRSSLPVDMDKARVAGGFRSVSSTQEAALLHLKHDEIDEALELFEDIIFAYYAYFEHSLKQRDANPQQEGGFGTTDFKPFIGVALHNLGILNLLNGEYKEAHSYFARAVENRKSCLGEGHPDHVTSLVKLAICLYALDDFAGAHARLEEALHFARESAKALDDRMQIAEILNNLGCLSYMCGQPLEAKSFFKESLDMQFIVMSQSLYEGSSQTVHSVSLNISIARANIGFVKLVTKDLPFAITALEAALMEQQLLLRGAHDTLISTMDHLAVANLLNGNQQQASQMFGRILQLQTNEYGPQDRRCFVTIEKINMVRRRGNNFENAVDDLRRTFSSPLTAGLEEPAESPSTPHDSKEEPIEAITEETKARPPLPKSYSVPSVPSTKGKNQKTLLKVFSSMRKKKTAAPR